MTKEKLELLFLILAGFFLLMVLLQTVLNKHVWKWYIIGLLTSLLGWWWLQ